MPSKITNNLRILNANQFLNLFSVTQYNIWESGTTYAIGDVVKYGIYKYVANSAGISGAIPPTHTSGVDSDGVVDWLFVEIFFDQNYFENKIYIGMAKTNAWRPDTGAWVATTDYYINDIVQESATYYIALENHTSTGTFATDLAGGLWEEISWQVSFVYEIGDFIEESGSYYLCNADHTSDATTFATDAAYWDASSTEDPITPENDFEHMYKYLDNLISAKKLSGYNASYGIERTDWTGSDAYEAFDPAIDDFTYGTTFFVVTNYLSLGVRRVYKCLDNAGGAISTDEPTGESAGTFRGTDGYLWKYMGKVEDNDFICSSYVPCMYKIADDGSTQWDTQNAAKATSLGNIKVTAAGTGYTNGAGLTISAPDVGADLAVAEVVSTGGVIDYINITNEGSGYIDPPTVTLPAGTGGTIEVVMAPKDGNGANMLKELNARYIIVQTEFDGTEGGYFPTPAIASETDFRQIVLMIDPIDWDGDVCDASHYIGYEHEDYVSTFPAWQTSYGYIVGDAVIESSIRYICNTIHTSDATTFATDAAYWDTAKRQINPGSGTLLYVDNSDVVTRQDAQIEDLKIILKF